MITLDQVRLLDEKIESCLAKIAELNAENDALRRKCAELTNALSAKSESLSSFQQDQSKIEEGILKALERLNAVESSILSVANGVQSPVQQNVAQVQQPVQTQVQQPIASSAGSVSEPAQHFQQPTQPQQPVQPAQSAQVQQPVHTAQTQQPVQIAPSTGSGTRAEQSQNEYDEMPTFDIF